MNGELVGECQLTGPEQKRMLNFFLNSKERSLGPFSDDYIEELKKAYSEETHTEEKTYKAANLQSVQQWHLNKIETKNYGGINVYEGQSFEFSFNSKGHIFQGDNGHGKTSLASSIIWAITGKTINCDKEPDTSSNHPQPVKDISANPVQLPHWPPVCSYPSDQTKWKNSNANTQVSLEFINDNGDILLMERELLPSGETKVSCSHDLSQVGIAPLLIETCILMPNKIAHIKLDESQDIVDAIIQLIGLQPLVDLADHVDKLCFRGQNFSRDPKQKDIDREWSRIHQNLDGAKKHLRDLGGDETSLKIDHIKGEDLEEHLSELQKGYEAEASKLLGQIKDYINKDIDLENQENKKAFKNALASLNESLLQPNYFENIESVRALDTLCSDQNKKLILELQSYVTEVLDTLQKADYIRLKQEEDQKLKLKAYAAEYHMEQHANQNSIDDCPLCERSFDTPELQELSKEISELKTAAELTRKTFEEVCKGIYADILEKMQGVASIKPRIVDIGSVKTWLDQSLSNELSSNKNLNFLFPQFTEQKTQELISALSNCPVDIKKTDDPRLIKNYPESATTVIRCCERIFALYDIQKWWDENRQCHDEAWKTVFENDETEDQEENKGIQGAIKVVAEAEEKAQPYDNISSRLEQAVLDTKTWYELFTDRYERDKIRKAILPLKELRAHVEDQVRQTLDELGDRASEIFQSIYLPTSLKFSKAGFGKKKTINIKAIVNGTAEIDATLIANSSWLYAVLWSFWLALRESVLKQTDHNPFPLVVLDDPQATFDFHHARAWARYFGKMSHLDVSEPEYSQIILTTYDKMFLDDLEHHADFKGEVAYLNRSNSELTIVNGSYVKAAWDHCASTQEAKDAQEYIEAVRNEYEGVLKILLRGQFPDIENDSFGKLAEKLNTLATKDIAPYDRPNIKNFAACVNNKSLSAIVHINASHHHGDRDRLSYSDAKEVKNFYDGKGKFKPALNAHRSYVSWITQDNSPPEDTVMNDDEKEVNE